MLYYFVDSFNRSKFFFLILFCHDFVSQFSKLFSPLASVLRSPAVENNFSQIRPEKISLCWQGELNKI